MKKVTIWNECEGDAFINEILLKEEFLKETLYSQSFDKSLQCPIRIFIERLRVGFEQAV